MPVWSIPNTFSGTFCVTNGYTMYSMTVHYKSGPSKAARLYPKTSDSSGRVLWPWMVGTHVQPKGNGLLLSNGVREHFARVLMYDKTQNREVVEVKRWGKLNSTRLNKHETAILRVHRGWRVKSALLCMSVTLADIQETSLKLRGFN